MGAVFLGRDEMLGRQVAMKRVGMAPGSAHDGESVHHRAEREARIAASLNHPHVVAVFDLVEEDDHQWLVMEYVDGRSLSQLVREEGPLDRDRAAEVLADAAHALAAAHAEGIVHRDVKPSNILLTVAGEAKLLDFGIAKAQGDLTLTQTGLVSGSPAYLSPEVASGRPATTASDVWSIGATLFHLLTGRPPYDVSDNLVGGLYRIVHQEPPTVEQPGWLAPLMAATMTRDPDDRWSMSHVASFLDAGPGVARTAPVDVADPEATQSMSPPTALAMSTAAAQTAAVVPPAPAVPAAGGTGGKAPRRRRGPLVLVAVVALLLLAIVVFLLLPDDQPNLEQTVPSPPTPSASETSSPSPTSSPSATPRAGPTAEGVGAFITDYLRTAAADQQAGFALLTPQFQDQSNGITGYSSFWGKVSSIESVTIDEVDVKALTVRYTYSYRTDAGGEFTESPVLRLSFDRATGSYLIAGEA